MTKLEQAPYFDQNATVAKLVFLAVITIALCSIGMGLFASIPLAIAFLLYGRLVTLSVAGISLGLLYAAVKLVPGFSPLVPGMYLASLIYAVLVAEVVFRNVNPVKGLIVSGLILVVLTSGALVAFDSLGPRSLKSEISQSVSSMMGELKKQKQTSSDISGEQERAFDDFVNRPEALANDIYTSLPWIVFIFCYFGLWISLYVTLRNSLVWRYKVLYNYGLKDLTHFKVPDFFVYPLILSLVLMLGADYGLPAWSEVVGSNLLYCLGVFYLFQGFGVYNDFLKFLRIGGFVKTLFIAFTFILAPKLLAVVGIFDLWFDFRKFFTKTKKDEGDTI